MFAPWHISTPFNSTVHQFEGLNCCGAGVSFQVGTGPLDRERLQATPRQLLVSLRVEEEDADVFPLERRRFPTTDLIEPLRQRVRVSEPTLENQVGIFHPFLQLMHVVVVAAFPVVFGLQFRLQSGDFREAPYDQALNLETEPESQVGIDALTAGHNLRGYLVRLMPSCAI